MKTVILAGGLGTRLAEETEIKPKPMVEIGGHPILWHIMQHYAHFGFTDFVIALGYKGHVIKKFMVEYNSLNSNMTVKLNSGQIMYHKNGKQDLTVELIDTGLNTQTGGRLKRLAPYIGSERFFMTYGDGVSNVDIRALLEFHKKHGKLCTLTAVHPPARFGHMVFDDARVVKVSSDLQTDEGWINGGFLVCEPQVLDYIDGDSTAWEKEPLERIAADGQLIAYKHEHFWQCMDTIRDKVHLENLWAQGNPPWKLWT